MFINTHHEEK